MFSLKLKKARSSKYLVYLKVYTLNMKTKHSKCTDIIDQVKKKKSMAIFSSYNFLSSLFYLSKYRNVN